MLSVGLSLANHLPAIPSGVAGTKIYADFIAKRYFLAGQSVPASTIFSCSRPTLAWTEDKTSFASNALRIGTSGLYVEEARTNYVLNSFAPVSQNVSLSAGTFTLSVGAGGAASVSGSATASASATAPTPFTLASSGTVTLTVSGAPLWIQIENGAFATSPILTTTAPATRDSDVVTLASPGLFTPTLAALYAEWDQRQSGGFAQNGVNNIIRWVQPEAWSRLRAGTNTLAQVAWTSGGLALNAGASGNTPVGTHSMNFTSTGSAMSIAWSASLDGMGGLASTTKSTWSSAVQSLQLGGAEISEMLNGRIRKLVIS